MAEAIRKNIPGPLRKPAECPLVTLAAPALGAEAVRLLSMLLEGADLVEHKGRRVRVAFDIDAEIFERLCVWRAAHENDEPEPDEDDGDREPDYGF